MNLYKALVLADATQADQSRGLKLFIIGASIVVIIIALTKKGR